MSRGRGVTARTGQRDLSFPLGALRGKPSKLMAAAVPGPSANKKGGTPSGSAAPSCTSDCLKAENSANSRSQNHVKEESNQPEKPCFSPSLSTDQAAQETYAGILAPQAENANSPSGVRAYNFSCRSALCTYQSAFSSWLPAFGVQRTSRTQPMLTAESLITNCPVQ